VLARRDEAVAVGVAGATLGYLTGRMVGLPVAAAVVGGASGLVNGWRRAYAWNTARGVGAFLADHTWALSSTLGGLASHVLSAVRGDAGYQASLSERRNRHVYARGFQVRRGFAMAMGNVVTGAGNRQRLVDDHEEVHIWQARLLGPVYPVAYVGWSVVAAPVGVVRWWRSGRTQPLGRMVDAVAYRANPLERWAYAHQARRATASPESPTVLR
jgi:hypothetical protein